MKHPRRPPPWAKRDRRRHGGIVIETPTRELPVVVVKEDDEWYTAYAPGFPDLETFAESRSEAIAELRDALATYFKELRKHDLPLPEPEVELDVLRVEV